jgi:hypothetical protein
MKNFFLMLLGHMRVALKEYTITSWTEDATRVQYPVTLNTETPDPSTASRVGLWFP